MDKAKIIISYQLTNYFKDYDYWKSISDDAIKSSKNKTVIIVDKFTKKCYVYNKEKSMYEFSVELSNNWMCTKLMENDKATPEGIYQIQSKIPSSTFYKALLISYPNKQDRNRFEQAKKDGRIPVQSKIGGLIEIHGKGGTGINWTDGCVALSDSDMDRLYDFVEAGTPTIIVGSIKELSYYFNNN